MKLPDACEKCAPFNGDWMETPAGLRRCDCARGAAKLAATQPRPPRPPAISPKIALMCVEMLAGMDYFPSDAGARGFIADEVAAMCADQSQAKWLMRRMSRLYRRWPGVIEMRTVFCASHAPLDGVPAMGASEVYPDGIPSENPPAEEPRRIEGRADRQISASPSITDTIRDLAVAKDLNRPDTFRQPQVREIPITRPAGFVPITEADIEAEVERVRAQKAKEEIDG